MKVALVNPPRFEGMSVCRITRCENVIRESVFTPFDLLIMFQILEDNGHEVYFLDANGQNANYDWVEVALRQFRPDVTVFHLSQECFKHDLWTGKLGRWYGSKEIGKVVGINWTYKTLAEEVYRDYGHVLNVLSVNHNYITSIPRWIDDGAVEDGIMDEDEPMPFSELPFPKWTAISDFNNYYTRVKSISPYAMTCASWGCPMSCRFCNYKRTGYNARRPEQVADEMKILEDLGVRYVHFYDATFNMKEQWVFDICDEIEKRDLHLKWLINARCDRWNEELAKRCKDNGLDGVSFGAESFNQEVLDLCHKGTKVEDTEKAVLANRKAGIKTNLSLMIGFPGFNRERIETMVRYLKKLKPNGFFVSPYGMCALPNTYWWEKEREEGLEYDWQTIHDWGNWRSYCDYTPEELQAIRKEIYKRVFWSFPYLFENAKWVLTHPDDLKIAVDFLGSTVQKFFRKWMYHR